MNKTKRRKRNKSIQQVTKEHKVEGNSYRKYRGKGEVVAQKTIGPDCQCHKKCFERVAENHRKKLFSDFWSLNSHDVQNAYIAGRMRTKNVSRRTKKCESRRTQTLEYTVLCDDGDICVCKNAFLSIHGLSGSRGRLEYIIKKSKIVT